MAKRNYHCALTSKDLLLYRNHQSGKINSRSEGDTATLSNFLPARQAFFLFPMERCLKGFFFMYISK